MKYLLAILFLFNSTLLLASSKLIPFSTDFCTAYPEGTFSHPNLWAKCCVEHDLFLWAGGSKKDRNEVDKNLKRCVAGTGATIHSKLIYFGVRLGSYSPIKFKGKLWGNGWNPRRKDAPLTKEEISFIEDFLKDHPSDALSTHEIDSLIDSLKSRRN